MKQNLNNWLAQKTDVPSIVAAGIIHPDKTTFSQIFSEAFPEAAANKIWPAISEMIHSAKNQNFPSGQWKWSFEKFAVHCILRTDGTCLATLTSRQQSSDETATVTAFLSEFRSL